MKRVLLILLFQPFISSIAMGQMLVYTVAGFYPYHAAPLGDGGPATSASLSSTEGIWMDGNRNLYISDMGHSLIRKVNTTNGIITTIAGNGTSGYSGDGGPAIDAKISRPYGLCSDNTGNVYFADLNNNVVRKVNVLTGVISTIAGGGISLSDGVLATNAQINTPQNVYVDSIGNIYYTEIGRIRKVNVITGIISTITGNGTAGLSGDGGPAVNAQVSSGVAGMIFDPEGNFYFADRTNSRIRKINAATGIITSIVGTSVGYSGDNGPATNAQIAGPIGLGMDTLGNLIIADNGDNFIRKVNLTTGIITTIAGVGKGATGSFAEGIPPLSAEIHPEFLYLDKKSGTIYYSNWSAQIHKIVNYDAAKSYGTYIPQTTFR